MQHPGPVREKEDPLVEGLRKRDQKAFEKMLQEYSGKVIQKARVLLNSVEMAEDAAQEVFLKAHREMHTIRGKNVCSWLMAITFNQSMDMLRQKKRVPREIPVPENSVLLSKNQELPEPSLEILNGLSETERAVVFLRIVENLKFDEIAEITGLAEGSVRNLLSKSLRKLREEGSK